ncbi:MAG: LPS biosynthesis protein WbpP, partial [Kiritimatiellia bacterium]|nr:LPS biosynthesis protein WbpP [Kiritimatiellia bacterium]
SLLDLLDALGRLTGRSMKPEFRPVRSGDVRHSAADIGRARQLLGYAPGVQLDEGLRALLDSIG